MNDSSGLSSETQPSPTPPVLTVTVAEAVELARSQIVSVPGGRQVLGITGAPGAGKSTLCAALAAALGRELALVGMDGFHLANAELNRLSRRSRKGAPDTFDVDGYVALLRRLRHEADRTVYAPTFDRTLEESIGSAVPVFAGTPLIVTEGNYLLLETGGWQEVRPLLHTAWFLDLPDEVRRARLVARHEAYGKPPEQAREWVQGVDERNAALIAATRSRADAVLQLIP